MNYTVKIDADVRDVLSRSIVTAASVVLPAGQLERKLYERVNKVLEAAGGKWSRSARAHLFTSDPREVLGLALVSHGITDERKAKQQFFTPAFVADLACERAELARGMRVLEPSAGEGSIAIVARARGCDVRCVEIDPVYADTLAACGFVVHQQDFLTFREFGEFDRVVMNPPFADGQDIAHVQHAFKCLKPGGRLSAVMAAGVRTNGGRKTSAFRVFVDTLNGSIEPLPDEAFKVAGTCAKTVLVSMEKPRL